MSGILLPLLILSLVPGCIEVDISVPGFPAMASYFNITEGVVQLTIAYNFLGFCLSAVFYGPLSDRYGRRRLMVIGNGLLLLGAIGCVMAPTIKMLLVARFIQGTGASASAVIASAIIADVYRGPKIVKALTIMNSTLTILMALAPVIGGFINKEIGWVGNYQLVAVICALSWGMLLLYLPETRPEGTNNKLTKVLLNYKMMFRSSRFIAHAMVPTLLYVCYITFVVCAPFLYIETFDLSVIAYALHQGCIVASFTVMSFFAHRIIQKIGKRDSIFLSISLCCSSIVVGVGISIIELYLPYLITLTMMVYGVGFAIGYPAIFADSLEIFPEAKGVTASAIMSLRTLLCAGFIGLASFVYNRDPLPIFLVLLGSMGIAVVTSWVVVLSDRKIQGQEIN